MKLDLPFYVKESVNWWDSGTDTKVTASTLSNWTANTLLSPSQRLFGSGKVYHLQGGHTHISYTTVQNKVMQVAYAILGVIHTTLCIFNFVGLAIKWLHRLSPEIIRAHEFVEQSIKDDLPMVSRTGMAQYPPFITPTESELKAIESIEISELASIFNEVKTPDSQEIAAHKRLVKKKSDELETWLSSSWTDDLSQNDAALVKKNLCKIIYLKKHSSLSQNEMWTELLKIANSIQRPRTLVRATKDALKKFLGNKTLTHEELKEANSIDSQELVSMWNEVSVSDPESMLRWWLTYIVPNEKEYNIIALKQVSYAKDQLERNIKLIIHQMKTQTSLSKHKKENLILTIIDALTCSPTWIEITHQVYKSLKGGGEGKEYVLSIVDSIKEDLEAKEAQKKFTTQDGLSDYGEWHGKNITKQVGGKELGLDRANLKFDNSFHIDSYEAYLLKGVYRERFFDLCSPKELINRFIQKVDLEQAGTNGLDPKLTKLLASYAIEFANKQIKKIANGVAKKLLADPDSDFQTVLNHYVERYDPTGRCSKGFISQIVSDNPPLDNHRALAAFIQSASAKFAVTEETPDFDPGVFVTKVFFDEYESQKFLINQAGAYTALKVTGILS